MIYKKKITKTKKLLNTKKNYIFSKISLKSKKKRHLEIKIDTHFIHFIFIIFTYISAKNEKLFQEAGGRG